MKCNCLHFAMINFNDLENQKQIIAQQSYCQHKYFNNSKENNIYDNTLSGQLLFLRNNSF